MPGWQKANQEEVATKEGEKHLSEKEERSVSDAAERSRTHAQDHSFRSCGVFSYSGESLASLQRVKKQGKPGEVLTHLRSLGDRWWP